MLIPWRVSLTAKHSLIFMQLGRFHCSDWTRGAFFERYVGHAFNIMACQPTTLAPFLRKLGLIPGPTKGNQWFSYALIIWSYFLGGEYVRGGLVDFPFQHLQVIC